MSEQDADGSDSTADGESTEHADTPEESAEQTTEAADAEDTSAADGEDEPQVDGTDEPGVDFKESDLDVADDVVEYVETGSAEEISEEIATLRFEVETLEDDIADYEQRIEDLESKLKRKQADFENYKKRMQRRREEEKERATEDLVERLVDVRDNLQLAIEQDDDADIREGIESTLRQFDRVLDEENVTPIEPEPGDDVDPKRHEVLVRMDSEEAPGTIAQVHRPGYEMAEKVIRAAQVAVSEEES